MVIFSTENHNDLNVCLNSRHKSETYNLPTTSLSLQCCPVSPFGHVQRYEKPSLKQRPPFSHGEDLHWLSVPETFDTSEILSGYPLLFFFLRQSLAGMRNV